MDLNCCARYCEKVNFPHQKEIWRYQCVLAISWDMILYFDVVFQNTLHQPKLGEIADYQSRDYNRRSDAAPRTRSSSAKP
jgi:hypothetical protein